MNIISRPIRQSRPQKPSTADGQPADAVVQEGMSESISGANKGEITYPRWLSWKETLQRPGAKTAFAQVTTPSETRTAGHLPAQSTPTATVTAKHHENRGRPESLDGGAMALSSTWAISNG